MLYVLHEIIPDIFLFNTMQSELLIVIRRPYLFYVM